MGRSSELAVIDRLFRWGAGVGDDDARLLERFRDRRDEAAFAALVDRHGPMVLGVCRRSLRDDRDVEDAFQATFLILARRVGTIRGASGVGPWLHGVAHRVATRSRADTARRFVREGVRLEVEPAGQAGREAERDELRSIVDDELGRLPGRFRDPVILCHLEGLTHDQAADRLCLPVGTVRSRLARARTKLRDRLERRGLSATDAPTFLPLAEPLPPALLEATLRSSLASATTSSTTLAAAGAVALADGVLQTMTFSQAKLAAAAIATLLTLGTASGYALQQGGGGKPDAPADSTPAATAPEQVGQTNEAIATEDGAASSGASSSKAEKPPKKSGQAGTASDKKLAKNLRDYLEKIETTLRTKKFQQGLLRSEITGMEADIKLIQKKIKEVEARIAEDSPGSLFVTTEKSDPLQAPKVSTKPVTARGAMVGPEGMGGQGAIRTTEPYQDVARRARGSFIQGPGMIIAISSNGRILTGYSTKTGEAKSLRIAPDGPDEIKAVPIISASLAAVQFEGPKIERIAVFSPTDGAWHSQTLREPATKAVPIIGPAIAVYRIESRIYAFSSKANRWDVLELPPETTEEPSGGEGMMPGMGMGRMGGMGGGMMGQMVGTGGRYPALNPDSATYQSDHQLHIFSVETGRWTSIEIEAPEEGEAPEPTP